MDTIVKVLNEKVADGDAKTIVEALKQIDPNAEGETVAEVLKNMEIGGGGGGSDVKYLSATIHNDSESYPLQFGQPNIVPVDIETFILYDPNSPFDNGGVEANDTKTVYFLYSGAGSDTAFVPLSGINSSSNAVNCEVLTDEYDSTYIAITDPTQNSSISLEMTGSR